jgi:hypothetical protein
MASQTGWPVQDEARANIGLQHSQKDYLTRHAYYVDISMVSKQAYLSQQGVWVPGWHGTASLHCDDTAHVTILSTGWSNWEMAGTPRTRMP